MPTKPRSSSVCVHFPPEQAPRTLDRAAALFEAFGDIARIEMTLTAVTGCILVTFFDVRCAEKVVAEFQGGAELFREAAHDFRAVSIAASIFAEMPPTMGGFHTFGEIAGVSICGEDMVVEFYDMRAAQQVISAVPGSRPRPSPPLPGFEDPAPAAVGGGSATQAVSLLEYLKEWQAPDAISAAAAFEAAARQWPEQPPVPPAAAAVPTPAPRRKRQKEPKPAGPVSPATANAGSAPIGAAPEQPALKQNNGRPVREKVNSKDLTKFDIVPDNISSGKDQRTTVMVRNIPKVCTRDDFAQLLANCGLADRYDFFYMPFDKRRNDHCGFAFVNFKTSHDVLQLWRHFQLPAFCGFSDGKGEGCSSLAVNYARLQGQEQLIKHFSVSAVMFDPDERMRPQFAHEVESKILATGVAPPKAAGKDKEGPAGLLEPQFIEGLCATGDLRLSANSGEEFRAATNRAFLGA
mmetsp:Transcript_119640/g.333907  ORF Transcript_119640/g.333907 Transcript_119640/m.333907 type:complete len:464 (+) Transcript_119640:73-1464(+)